MLNIQAQQVIQILNSEYFTEEGKIAELEKFNLIASDLNTMVIGNNRDSILHLAVSRGGKRLTEWLLKKSPQLINKKNRDNQNVLFVAIEKNTDDSKLCQYLLELFLKNDQEILFEKDTKGYNLLFYLASFKTAKILTSFQPFLNENLPKLNVQLEKRRYSTNTAVTGKKTISFEKVTSRIRAVHKAAESGNVEFIKLLVANKIEVNVEGESYKFPLHIAAEHCQKEVIKYLTEVLKIPIDQPMRGTRTALLLLAINHQKNEREGTEILCEGGADVNYADTQGLTALHLACESGNNKVVEVLIDHGAVFNKANQAGDFPLHTAARNGHVDCVEYLIKNTFAPIFDLQHDKNNHHYLTSAIIRNQTKVVEKIFELEGFIKSKFANFNMPYVPLTQLTFNNGNPLVHVFALLSAKHVDYDRWIKERKKIFNFLLKKNLNINAVNFEGDTVLHSLVNLMADKKNIDEEDIEHLKGTLKLLIRAGLDITKKNHSGNTAFGLLTFNAEFLFEMLPTILAETVVNDTYLNAFMLDFLNNLCVESHPVPVNHDFRIVTEELLESVKIEEFGYGGLTIDGSDENKILEILCEYFPELFCAYIVNRAIDYPAAKNENLEIELTESQSVNIKDLLENGIGLGREFSSLEINFIYKFLAQSEELNFFMVFDSSLLNVENEELYLDAGTVAHIKSKMLKEINQENVQLLSSETQFKFFKILSLLYTFPQEKLQPISDNVAKSLNVLIEHIDIKNLSAAEKALFLRNLIRAGFKEKAWSYCSVFDLSTTLAMLDSRPRFLADEKYTSCLHQIFMAAVKQTEVAEQHKLFTEGEWNRNLEMIIDRITLTPDLKKLIGDIYSHIGKIVSGNLPSLRQLCYSALLWSGNKKNTISSLKETYALPINTDSMEIEKSSGKRPPEDNEDEPAPKRTCN